MSMRGLAVLACIAGVVFSSAGRTVAASADDLPRYSHVFIIIEENKDYDQILGGVAAPEIGRFAKTYGVATQFYAEVHPSEANYVALLGGDTFGIHDDDAFYCHAGMQDKFCAGASASGYADHTVATPSLGQQLEAKGLTWKGYYEDIPEPGSKAVVFGSLPTDSGPAPAALYASKHSGFMNFKAVQDDPQRAQKIVGFDQFEADLKAEALPNFALIVPNQCNEMHGLNGPGVPADCHDTTGLIRRGDAYIGGLVRKLMATKAWNSAENVAIILTFDEGTGGHREGCCGVTPGAPSNYGGGRIPTVILTNHGPRGVVDATPYSHYSMLRTLEDVFGIHEYLGHAAETDKGVKPMTPLFATAKP